MSWCLDCPRMDFSEEDLAKIRERVPEFELRKVCCMHEHEMEEKIRATPGEVLEARKLETDSRRPYSGAPRNRHERRAAAKKARA